MQDSKKSPANHSSDIKLSAAVAWVMTGSSEQTARIAKVPLRTVQYWMSSDWWASLVEYAKDKKMSELDVTLSTIISLAAGRTRERLELGDAVLGKNGDIILKPVSAKDCAIIASIFIDKRAVLSKNTSVPSKTTSEDLNDIRTDFESFAPDIAH